MSSLIPNVFVDNESLQLSLVCNVLMQIYVKKFQNDFGIMSHHDQKLSSHPSDGEGFWQELLIKCCSVSEVLFHGLPRQAVNLL